MVAVDGEDIDRIDLKVDRIRRSPDHRSHPAVANRLTGIRGCSGLVVATQGRNSPLESIPYKIASPPDAWKGEGEPFGCFWCSWNRRKALFDIAHELRCTKIAFAHHMDDIIETILLNLFFQGEIGTMQPYQEMFEGELAPIRPLAYVEEHEIVKLSRVLNLPVISSECPHSNTSKRHLLKGIIKELKQHNKNVKKNIFRSLQRIRGEYLLAPRNGNGGIDKEQGSKIRGSSNMKYVAKRQTKIV